MKIASLGYLPPKERFYSDQFVTNLSAWSARHPIYLYSDDASWGDQASRIANPEAVKNPRKPFAVNNCVFLFGLKLAKDLGLDYFLYLESDCRVRAHGWDDVIFQDAFREQKTPLFYGTPVMFNISQSGRAPLRAAIDLAYRYQTTTRLLSPVHGAWPGAPAHFSLFPNGALGIYHTQTMLEIFNGFEADIGRAAAAMAAWDFDISTGMWNKFGDAVFDHFQFATQCYSGYGDTLITHDERMDLLLTGKMVAIHQVKTGQTCTE